MSNSTEDQHPLRFKVGDRVDCNMGIMSGWMTGTVIKCRYVDHVLSNDGTKYVKQSGPYQVRLDDQSTTQNFIYAKWDDDGCIRRSASPHKCAGCGKCGGESLRYCGACKMVKYCGGVCQKHHRKQHKAECKRRVDDIRDELLFQRPPPPDECPICMLRLPIDPMETTYLPCCGKQICGGCVFYSQIQSMGQPGRCPFCREPDGRSDAECIQRLKQRIEKNDARAHHIKGTHYRRGDGSVPQDTKKAFELWQRGSELGSVECLGAIATAYTPGVGVNVGGIKEDKKKAQHYWELAAISGHVIARYNVASLEMQAKRYRRAMQHYVLAAECGHEPALDAVKEGYKIGDVTKEEFANTLRAFKDSCDELKSEQRDLYVSRGKGGRGVLFT